MMVQQLTISSQTKGKKSDRDALSIQTEDRLPNMDVATSDSCRYTCSYTCFHFGYGIGEAIGWVIDANCPHLVNLI